MTSLKMWSLLTLLLMLITPTVTEVLQSMAQCGDFLLQKPPQVPGILENGTIMNKNRYKVICQTYSNTRTFVTLYDIVNKIPVLSAYKYRGEETGRPGNEIWKIEPQLEDWRSNKNMEDCNDNIPYNYQASDNDYRNNDNYNRGHLFPSSFAYTETDKISTFTLTNIVPQSVTFNSGSWEKMEKHVKCILTNYCENHEGYVTTGAQPGTDTLNGVNIPSMLWSAFCCYNHQNSKWIAGAFWGDNKPDTTNLPMKTLAQLSQKLSTTDSSFEVFPGPNRSPSRCPQNESAKVSLDINNLCRYQSNDFTNISHKDEEAL